MYQRRQITVRMDPEVYAKVATRASENGLTVPEWLNKAAAYVLTKTDVVVKVTETKEYTL